MKGLSSATVVNAIAAASTLKNANILSETLEPVPHMKTTVVMLLALSVPFVSMIASKHLSQYPAGHRIIWAVAFGINLLTLNIPGRFDSMRQDGKIGPPWKTLFEPSGWAFAIWAVIYLGELLITAYAGVIGKPMQVFQQAAPYWLAGNLFQSLWCLTFRPQFKAIMWLPAVFLAFGSASLLMSHNIFTQAIASVPGQSLFQLQSDKLLFWLIRTPLALHATWLAAATCLNINGWAAVMKAKDSTQIALAFTSAFIAGAFGIIGTIATGDPFIAGTAAWALAALASRTSEKSLDPTSNQSVRETNAALAMVEQGLSYVLRAVAVGVPAAKSCELF